MNKRKYTITPEERERRRNIMVEMNKKADYEDRVRHLNEINLRRKKEKEDRENTLQERVNFLEDLCRRHGLDIYL